MNFQDGIWIFHSSSHPNRDIKLKYPPLKETTSAATNRMVKQHCFSVMSDIGTDLHCREIQQHIFFCSVHTNQMIYFRPLENDNTLKYLGEAFYVWGEFIKYSWTFK
jgi:hypothetical protein